MSTLPLKCKDYLVVAGVSYVIDSFDHKGNPNLRRVETDEIENRDAKELFDLWTAGGLERVIDPRDKLGSRVDILSRQFCDLDPRDKREAQRKYAYLKAFLELSTRCRSARVLLPVIADVAERIKDPMPVSVKTLQRAIALWFSIGAEDLRDIRILVPNHRGKGNTNDRLDMEVTDMVDEVLKGMANSPSQPSMTDVHHELLRRLMNANAKRAGLPDLVAPSLRTLYRYYSLFSQSEKVGGRLGKKEVERTLRPVMLGPQGDYPLQVCEMDHSVINVRSIHKESGALIGRPWLTLLFDRRCRAVVGVHLGFEAPSFRSVAACLRHGIRPKADVLKAHPAITGDWPIHGLPRKLVLDNGPDFHSASLEEACDQLMIDIDWCAAYTPGQKGKIERWFRSLKAFLRANLPGATASIMTKKPQGDLSDAPALTLEDLYALILKWIVDVYHVQPHRKIGEAPIEKWKREIVKTPPRFPGKVTDVDVLLDLVEYRKLTRKGIELHGLMFNSSDLFPLLVAADKPDVCKVKVDADDLSHIYLHDWRSGRYIQVPTVDPDYCDGLTLAEHNFIVARAREARKRYERLTIGMLVQAKHELRQMVIQMRRNKKLVGPRIAAIHGEKIPLRRAPQVLLPAPVAPVADLLRKAAPAPHPAARPANTNEDQEVAARASKILIRKR